MIQQRREKQFNDAYSRLLHEKQTLVREIEEMLEVKDNADDRRRQLLYRQWCEQVFDPIQARLANTSARSHTMQQQIAQTLEGETPEELSRRKRQHFEAFLRAANSRAIFRDIVAESDYDPMAPLRETVTYSLRGVTDPVKKDLNRVCDNISLHKSE